MRVGVIGLGAMGLPMAVNLVKAGFDVRGFDLRKSSCDAFEQAGGSVATSLTACATASDVLLLMVVNGEQALSVLFGDEPAVDALPPEAIVIMSCTQPPQQAAATGMRLAERQIRMLDAPVSGGTAGAQAGTLAIMVSGPRHAYEQCEGVLQAVGKHLFFLGEQHGAGSTAKLINQLLCGVHIAAAAEAMNVAERAGVPLEQMHRIISVSAGNSWMWGDRGPRMLQDDPPVKSAVDIFVKDLGIVLGHGHAARQALPLAAAAHQLFLSASGLGHGGEDDSQVIKAYRALNGGAPSRPRAKS